jgi:hypothetical protein
MNGQKYGKLSFVNGELKSSQNITKEELFMSLHHPRMLRLFLAASLSFGLFGLLLSLPGDLAPATAQEAPTFDQFVSSMEASVGYFSTYKKPDGTLYLEVKKYHFNKDFLVVIQMARGIGESFLLTGYPLRTDMMTLRMRNDKIELVTRNPYFRGEKGTPLGRMVDLGFRESVRQTFAIVSRDEAAGRYLVDATGLFLSDWPGLGDVLPQIYSNVRFNLDRSRSTLMSVKSFPQNVEVEVDLTFAASSPIPSMTIPDEKSLPIAYHYSLLALPDEPMKPRVADDRVGYFTTTYKDFSQQYGPTNTVRLANRWRIEKKDPYAPLSEPVKPIVFYLENTIPKEFKPYIKEGIEAWNKAFESAGIKNALVVMDQPNDPNWDAGDARYSTIRWMPSVSSVFAIGPSDVDPRSGEILNADILFTSDWVRVLAGEHDRMADTAMDSSQEEAKALELARLLNPEHYERLCAYGAGMAQHMALLRYTLMVDGSVGLDGKIPVEYVGAALRETTMHEVGHAFGLRHNFKASTAVPNEELHDTNFTKEHGISASVMDYNPPNISSDRSKQGEYYSSAVGPYDQWAVKWGYLPVGNETLEPHAELQNLAAEHYRSEHRYGTDEDAWVYPFALDPEISQWDLGSDNLAYYEDLQKLVGKLWTGLETRLIREGGEFWPLRGAVNALLSEKMRGYMSYTKSLGGLEVTRAHQGDPENLTPLKVISGEEQRRALAFILRAFTPEAIGDFPKELLDKITPQRWWDWASNWRVGYRFTYPIHDIITAYRINLLEIAFWPERLMRIRDNAYRSGGENAFTLDELFLGFTDTIWADILTGAPSADSFQRAIQSAYLDKLIALATHKSSVGPTSTGSTTLTPVVNDARAMAYAELVRVSEAIGKALAGSPSAMAKAHLMEAQHRIEQALKAD